MRYWMNFNTKMKFQKGINNHLWHMYRIRSHQNTAYSSQGNERGSMNSHRPTPLISLTSPANTCQDSCRADTYISPLTETSILCPSQFRTPLILSLSDLVLDYSILYPHEQVLSADENTDYSCPQITYRLLTFSNYLQTTYSFS